MKGISVFRQRLIVAAAIVALLATFGASMVRADTTVNLKVKILAVNDFHGQLSPLTDDTGQQVGGAAYLTAYIKRAQAGMEDATVIVDAGDHVGASPANSALLMDEPSIMVLNTLANPHCVANKMDRQCNIVGILGNHEFDKGVRELKRKMEGGRYESRPEDHVKAPYLKDPYPGARYPVVCANVVETPTGKTLVPPYVIKSVRGVPIAFIGAVLKGTKRIVMPAFVAGLEFKDEAESINSYIPEIKAQGVHAIVAVVHQGDQNGQDPMMADIVKKLDPAVDVVISAHTHKGYARMLRNSAGKEVLVTQAWSYSTAIADITMEINPTTGEIVAKWANIATVNSGVAPDPEVQKIVEDADDMVRKVVSEKEGQAATDITTRATDAGESPLGDLIADALRTAREGIDFAFVNSGGIRAKLLKGPVTWGRLFDTQPFGNRLVTMSMTGQQIYELLEEQWSDRMRPNILQVSGLTYQWKSGGGGKRRIVVNGSVRKDGVPIDRSASYTVATNDYLATGGDGFWGFTKGTSRQGADGPPVDVVDVLAAYVRSLPNPFREPVDAGKRVTRVP